MASSPIQQPVIVERRLLKSMRWYDGFIVCLSASGFMLSTLGYSIGAIGALAALALWGVSVVIGAAQTYIFTEPATLLGDCSGGLAAYAREGWRRRFNLFSPLGGFAYWIAYTSTLSVFGLLAAQLIQAQWFASQSWAVTVGSHTLLSFSQVVAVVLILAVWFINISGMRPTKVFGYVTGIVFFIPLLLFAFAPYLTGTFHPHFLTWGLGQPGQEWGGLRLVLVWLYLMGWSAYPTEQAATFAPEYVDTVKDTRRGLMSSAGFAVGIFLLVPLGLGGVLPQSVIAANPVSFYVLALRHMIGPVGSGLAVLLIVIACLLTMNASTMNASRALYATSARGYTLRVFGRLNRNHVPANAMTLDMVVNTAVVILLNSVIGIIAASNMAYFVIVILALLSIITLRRDMANAARPIKLRRGWLFVAAGLAAFDFVLLCVGSVSFQLTGYGGLGTFFVGLGALLTGVVLYLWRSLVQDKKPLLLKDERPFVAEGDTAVR